MDVKELIQFFEECEQVGTALLNSSCQACHCYGCFIFEFKIAYEKQHMEIS